VAEGIKGGRAVGVSQSAFEGGGCIQANAVQHHTYRHSHTHTQKHTHIKRQSCRIHDADRRTQCNTTNIGTVTHTHTHTQTTMCICSLEMPLHALACANTRTHTHAATFLLNMPLPTRACASGPGGLHDQSPDAAA